MSEPKQVTNPINLYEGADLLTLDPSQPLIRNRAIAVSGAHILAVGPQPDLAKTYGAQATRINWSGRLVLPGLVDGHSHLFQSLGHRLGDGLSLLPWLERFMRPYPFSMRPLR